MSTIHLVDPAARPIAASLKAFDPEHESLDAFRAQSRATYAQISPPMPEAREEHLIAGSPAVRVLVYRPRQPGPPSAAIVYLHGGGFITGEAEIADATCVRLAQENNAVLAQSGRKPPSIQSISSDMDAALACASAMAAQAAPYLAFQVGSAFTRARSCRSPAISRWKNAGSSSDSCSPRSSL